MFEHLHHRDYLGDGVYAGWDGFQVILWLEEPPKSVTTIAMEDATLNALNRYRTRLVGLLKEEKDAHKDSPSS